MASNAERLRELFDRFWNHGDWRAGADLFADDIEWHGIDEVGLGGPPRRGAREVGLFFREWLEAWEDYSNDIELEEITPDVILVESHFKGRGKGSGIVAETVLGQIWEFEDGKVVKQTMYRSPEEARKAAGEFAQADAR